MARRIPPTAGGKHTYASALQAVVADPEALIDAAQLQSSGRVCTSWFTRLSEAELSLLA